MQDRYLIIKIMNNNVLLARRLEDHQEMILVGKGIGFGVKMDSQVTLAKNLIEKAFVTYDKTIKEQYYQLIQEMDSRIIGLCEELIAKAEFEMGKVNQQLHVVLADHIGFAVERIRQGMVINNPFLMEIKALYPEEFALGQYARKKALQDLNVDLPEDEAAFIALHFHAARQNKTVKDTVKQTRILKEIIEIIQLRLNLEVQENELTYLRLINHLRGVIDRLLNKKNIENPLLESIRREFKESYAIVLEIKALLEKNYQLPFSESEMGFMALHIERIKNVSKSGN